MNTLKQYIKRILIEFQSKTPILGPSSPSSNNIYWGPGGGMLIRPGQEHLPVAPPIAVCCFIRRNDGKILGVTRKTDHSDWGLPGGKVDEGETLEQAATRELKEETGLDAIALKPIYNAVDSQGYDTTVFLTDVQDIDSIFTNETGKIGWITPQELLNGSFGDFFVEMQSYFAL